jgi:hypothetical protein
MSRERERLREPHEEHLGWGRWGPYVADRAWGTVREDYSADADAWSFVTHDIARSKSYRWGEDGIAAICDRYQLLVFAPAFWNGVDPILKERLFGLNSHEGNHGEDVKEYYFYLDNTPTHSYMKYLYKYPHAPFPYEPLVRENARRTTLDFEYELLDTGVFDGDRYFDIVIEYAKHTPEDIAVRIEAINRGPEPAPLHILPHLWFRNTWGHRRDRPAMPRISRGASREHSQSLMTCESTIQYRTNVPGTYRLGPRFLAAPPGGRMIFTDNETNRDRAPDPGRMVRSRHHKDAFHRHIIGGEDCLNPEQFGTRAAIHYTFDAIPPGGSAVLRLRLADRIHEVDPLVEVDSLIDLRRAEADEFFAEIHPPGASDDERRVQRQALAGLLWTKQLYYYNVNDWLLGDVPDDPPPPPHVHGRNRHWKHVDSMRIMTVPDKWEYPWFAAWDLAFQCVTMTLVDADFAKSQLWFLLFEQFMHPSGQVPAYEWEFSDNNPPVLAWAVWRIYNMDRIRNGQADRPWMERCFHKLLINFAWWVNKLDRKGDNIFEGGFLGLDNITVLDRSVPCDDGSHLEQSDATGWMGMFCLNLMRIALELAKENQTYEALATKFFQHYVYIAAAMKRSGHRGYQLWDTDDGFFYDVLAYPDGRFRKFRVRSLVGLIPLFAVERLEEDWVAPFAEFQTNFHWFLEHRKDLTEGVVHRVENEGKTTHVLTVLDLDQFRRISERLYSPDEVLSDFGIRSLSKAHAAEPFLFDGQSVGYEPAESRERIKGGNSNWRGPIWFPMNFLLIESFRKLAKAVGEDAGLYRPEGGVVPFPTASRAIADRLISIFTRGPDGRRPVFGGTERFQSDLHWRDLILFYEYFHGDNGAGLGASHQTGWTSLVASLIDEWR